MMGTNDSKPEQTKVGKHWAGGGTVEGALKKEQNRVQGVNGEKRSKQVCTVKGGISDDWLQREKERDRERSILEVPESLVSFRDQTWHEM